MNTYSYQVPGTAVRVDDTLGREDISWQYHPEKRRQRTLDADRNNEHVFIYTANNRRHVQKKTCRGMSIRRVHLVRTATPVLAPVMENGVEPVVSARADLVLGYLEVLLAPEVHAAETQQTNRGGARQNWSSHRKYE